MAGPVSLELDPIFLKGLSYLHSKSKDSAEKLKALLDESLARGSDSSYRSLQKVRNMSVTSVSTSLYPLCVRSVCIAFKANRLVDLGEVDPPKKPRLEKPESRSSPITVQTSKDLLPNINDYDETNADDFAMEMGLVCVVCRYILIISF
ncbi:hypothetical protein GOODEAATRI_000827 [Goodea atripinnis]|uniref:Uncharacterized protein n=1 Tax=Goodea atripinnis TaxID=208336 RepID=A0ABV0P0B3_9TELE